MTGPALLWSGTADSAVNLQALLSPGFTSSIANSIDGGARTPQHVFYMVGGGALVLIGIATVANRGRRGV